MNRICSRILTLAVVVMTVAVPAMAQTMHQNAKWDRSYQLTPLEHKRLRAKGLSNKEVFMAANVARLRRADIDFVADMIILGGTSGDAMTRLSLIREWVETPRPEWLTPEWEAAVQRGDWMWFGPTTITTTTTTTTPK